LYVAIALPMVRNGFTTLERGHGCGAERSDVDKTPSHLDKRIDDAVKAYRVAITARATCIVLDVHQEDDVDVVARDAAVLDLKRAERYVMSAARMERAEHLNSITDGVKT
jgi:hypothetical protein